MTASAPARIIVVDDDLILRARIVASLRGDSRFEVVGEAGGLGDALALAARAPDLALIDLGLPDGHGGALISHLRQAAPACKSLVLTIFEDRKSVLEAIRAGADGYVLKDMPDADIRGYVAATLAGDTQISPRAAVHLLKELRGPEADPGPEATDDHATLLSPREKQLLELLARGASRKDAARELGISPFTAAEYLQNVYRKLRVNSRAEAVYQALQAKLIQIDPARG